MPGRYPSRRTVRPAPGQYGRPFGQQHPGGIAPRYEVPHLVVHLERGTGRATGVPGAEGQPGQRGAQGLQHAGHEAERGVDQRVQLLVGLLGVGEEPGQRTGT